MGSSKQSAAALLLLVLLVGALAVPVPLPEGEEQPDSPKTTPEEEPKDAPVGVTAETTAQPPQSPSETTDHRIDESITSNPAPIPEEPGSSETADVEERKRPATSFVEFNINKDGFVDRDEFSQVGSFSPESFEEADIDKDGLLTEEEFQFFSAPPPEGAVTDAGAPPSVEDVGEEQSEGDGDSSPAQSVDQPVATPEDDGDNVDVKAVEDAVLSEEQVPEEEDGQGDDGGEDGVEAGGAGVGQEQPEGGDVGDDQVIGKDLVPEDNVDSEKPESEAEEKAPLPPSEDSFGNPDAPQEEPKVLEEIAVTVVDDKPDIIVEELAPEIDDPPISPDVPKGVEVPIPSDAE